MSVTPANMLFILSDEHTRDIAGCYGHPFIRTPNIDRLAARGTKFANAYTNCPICVPARASLQTGRYVGDIGFWDNAHPYDGSVRSWGHRLSEAGHRTTSIGKLHFRSAEDSNGFDEEVMPLHVVDGVGDLLGMIRRPQPATRGGMPALAADAGPGESTYAAYDRRIRDAAIAWLKTRAAAQSKPWCLFVSFVKPHFPLIAPPEFFALYPPERLAMPRLYGRDERPKHPVVQALQRCMNYDDYFTPERVKVALAAYYGMVSFLDDNIGRVLRVLDETGLAASTRVVYTTDHGDNLGTRGLWGKSVHYEEAAAIPLIVAGPDIPAGKTVATPATLVDCYQTITECVGLAPTKDESALPGRSLITLARGADEDRVALGEYHAAGAITAMYMVRKGRWKYIHHVGYRPELFDLETDRGETVDLGDSPAHADVRRAMEAELRRILDPEKVCERAFADQAAKIAKYGGVEAIVKRGDFGYSPAPGQQPVFATRLEA